MPNKQCLYYNKYFQENIFWKFFYAETNSFFIIISMMYDPTYVRERWLTVRNQNNNGKNNDHYIESQIFYFDPS